MLTVIGKWLLWVLSHPAWLGTGVLVAIILWFASHFVLQAFKQEHQAPQGPYDKLIEQMREWRMEFHTGWGEAEQKGHTNRWDRALLAFGEPVPDTSLEPMAGSDARKNANTGWGQVRWTPVAEALEAILTGASGADTLRGTSNDDFLVGLDGDDTLIGLGGRDELRGGNGDDIYAGGSGADRFVFFLSDWGKKVIIDFEDKDIIVLKGDGWPPLADIIASAQTMDSGGYAYTLNLSSVETLIPLKASNFVVEF